MQQQDQFNQSFSPQINNIITHQNTHNNINVFKQNFDDLNLCIQNKNNIQIQIPTFKNMHPSTSSQSRQSKNSSSISSPQKTVEQLKKQLKKKQQRKKCLNNKIKSMIKQTYQPILVLQNIKQVTQDWIQMAQIGLNVLNDKKNNITFKKDKNQLFKMINKNYYQVRNYFDQLLIKNQNNQAFLNSYLEKLSKEENQQKFTASYSQNLKKDHQVKWQNIKIQSSQPITTNKVSQIRTIKRQKLLKKSSQEISLYRPTLNDLNSNMSLLKIKNTLSDSPSLSLNRQSPSLVNKINFPICQKVRQSIFGDLKKSIHTNLIQKLEKQPHQQLPKILKRYRTMTSKQIQQDQLQKIESIISMSERPNHERIKTQNFRFLNPKAQIIQIKRKKYLVNNIDLGEQIDEQIQKEIKKQSRNSFNQIQQQTYCLQNQYKVQNPHHKIARYSQESKNRKLQRLAFIQQLRHHLKLNSVPKKKSFIKQFSKQTQQMIKSPKVVSLCPENLLGQSSKKQQKFIAFTNRPVKNRYLKSKKVFTNKSKIFQKDHRSHSSQNPQNQIFFPNLI